MSRTNKDFAPGSDQARHRPGYGPIRYRSHLSRLREADRRAREQGERAQDANSGEHGSTSIAEEVTKLQQKAQQALVDTYSKLTPWQKTQVARHPDRPHCLDYVRELIEDFTPLAGDRYFAEDAAIMGGLGRFRGRPVVVIGHEKGSDTESRIQPQLRHGAAGGLSQGRAADGPGRQVRPARDHAGRHRRRLSRHRRRGARPGRGHRPLDRPLPCARRADGRPSSSAKAAPAAQ